MPKAFTHLCDKVNLSLFDDTLTVYPKPKIGTFQPTNEMELLFYVLFANMDCNRMQVGNILAERSDELGVYRFVHREDPGHDKYHQDDFSMDDSHYHAQFSQTVDIKKLAHILDVLQKYDIISTTEHQSFLIAYQQANKLPSQVKEAKVSSLSLLNTSTKVSETDTGKSHDKRNTTSEKPTFGGFKPGFLL